MNWLSSASLLALGFFLATSTWPKLKRPVLFSAALVGYGLPRRMAVILGPVLIAAEGIATVLCLAPIAPRVAGFAAGGLFAVYSAVVALTLLRGESQISCGCFAFGHDRPISWTLLARNAIAIGLTILPIESNRSASGALELVLAGLSAAVFALVLALADELGFLHDLRFQSEIRGTAA